MTCIAWDGKTLAADKRVSFGTLIKTTTKIFRVGDSLCALAGDAAGGFEVLSWYRSGANPADFPQAQRDRDNWSGLLVIKRGEILKYEYGPFPVVIEDKTFAVGCGRDFALAAMHLGCDARKAVEVAIALDSACGNGVDVLTMD